MIVKMKKITILTTEKSASHAVGELRKLGVVHVKHTQEPHADYITSIQRKLGSINEVLKLVKGAENQVRIKDKDELVVKEKEAISLGKEKICLLEEKEEFEKKFFWFSQWVNISQPQIADLAEKGIFLKLYLCSRRDLKKIGKDKTFYVVKRLGAQVCIVLISRNKNEGFSFSELQVPQEDKKYVEKHLCQLNCCQESIGKKIDKLSIYRNSFLEHKEKIHKRLEFAKVRFGMAHKEGICCLQGFCPQTCEDSLRKLAKEQGWAIGAQTPDSPQEVPTLIKTPKWLRIINPVFNFMGTLPGYSEYDISFWFLLFFSLFFAMLIGDAGYGIIFLLLTLFAQKKAKDMPNEPFTLMYVLSIVTIIWGAVTGTWFGFEKVAQLPVFKNVIISKMYSFNPGNEKFLQLMCFIIGAFHLSIAHAIVVFRRINSLKALAQLGWIAIIWSLFFVAGDLVLSRPMPQITGWLFAAGAAFVVLFSNPQKNVFKGLLLSLADLPLNVISSFSDVVSYIRLFAVGYASVVVASSFNEMALAGGVSNIWSALIAALILFVGHALNVVLGLMAIIVHGIRLNLLEFSGHLDMQWSGKKYEPFKE